MSEQENKNVEISPELMLKIKHYVANSNNMLMTIPVQGDQVISLAAILNEAQALFKEIEKYGK